MGARNPVVERNGWVLAIVRCVFRILHMFLSAMARFAIRSSRSKGLEVIALCHQLTVLSRQVNWPAVDDDDRTLLGAIAAALPRRLWSRRIRMYPLGVPSGPGMSYSAAMRTVVLFLLGRRLMRRRWRRERIGVPSMS